ncbi:MAG TPA: hypothetical protein VEA38_01670 [Terriglobales bacterium]|nr:hypothetical protein [Terriglobales bacterium]
MLVKFAPQAGRVDWQRVFEIVSRLPGVANVEVAPAPMVEHVGGSVQRGAESPKSPRYWLSNTLGTCIAEIGGSDLEAAMMQLFIECRGVFTGADVLFAALHSHFPKVWTADLRPRATTVYSQLRRKVAHCPYRLLPSGRGAYGLQSYRASALAEIARVSRVQDPSVSVVVEPR